MRLAVLAMLAASTPAFAQTVVTVENTAPGILGPTDGVTPQPDIATTVGPYQVLDLSTGHVSITDIEDDNPPVAMTTEQFWTAAGIAGTPAAFEHRAIYDPTTQRFYVSADEHLAGSGANRRYLAVSAGPFAIGPWQAVALPATAALLRTRLAVDANGVYLASDGSDGLTHVTAIPIADAVASPPSLAHASELTIAVADAVPALDAAHAKQPTDPEYFAARGVAANGDTAISVYVLTWQGGGATIVAGSAIDLGTAYAAPPATAVQPAPPLLDASDPTLRSVVAFGGMIYGLAATTVAGRAGAFWFGAGVAPAQLLMGGQLAVPGADVIVPALAVDQSNDIGLVAVATSATLSPTPMVTGQPAQGGTATMAPLQPIATASGTYACDPVGGVSVFGRTSALSVTPAGNQFFADLMYSGNDTGCGFSTALSWFIVNYQNYADDPAGNCCGACCGADGGLLPGDAVANGGFLCSSTPNPRDAAAPVALVALAFVSYRRRRRAQLARR